MLFRMRHSFNETMFVLFFLAKPSARHSLKDGTLPTEFLMTTCPPHRNGCQGHTIKHWPVPSVGQSDGTRQLRFTRWTKRARTARKSVEAPAQTSANGGRSMEATTNTLNAPRGSHACNTKHRTPWGRAAHISRSVKKFTVGVRVHPIVNYSENLI
jgi:hypothetical protein